MIDQQRKALTANPPTIPPEGKRGAIGRFVRAFRFAALAFTGILGWSAAALGQDPGEQAIEFSYDFRGAKLDQKLFRPIGPEAAARISFEAEGLRITLPAEQEKPDRVGLKTAFAVRGDFTITAAFEILQADRPKAGAGVGFLLYLIADTPTEAGFAFFRVRRVKEGEAYVCSHRISTGDGKRKTEDTVLAAKGDSGKLRVTRVGSEITVSAAEGDGDNFRELRRYEYGREDLKRVEVAAYPGRAANAVDLRVTDFRVRAESMPGLPAGAASNPSPENPPSEGGRTGLLLGLAVALALGMALLALLSLRRRKTAAAPAPGGQAGTEAETPVSFRCSGCGKTLRAKASLAGKAIKCPHCGQAVSVP